MGLLTRIKTWVAGESLAAATLNTEFDNIVNNFTPDSMDSISADNTAMQATSSPGGVGTEARAGDLATEIKQLRYMIKAFGGGSTWYDKKLIQTAGINDSAITTAKIADANVTTGKIADNAITQAKRASLGQQLSASSGTYSATSGSVADVTNLTVTITTTGRPVFIGLIGDGTSNVAQIASRNNSERTGINIYLIRDSSTILETIFQSQAENSGGYNHIFAPPSLVSHIDIPAAGTYTYKIQANALWPGSIVDYRFNYIKLIAYEL